MSSTSTVTCDERGVSHVYSARPWSTKRVGGRLLPFDVELDSTACFVTGPWCLDAYELPDQIEWGDGDDERGYRRLTLRWPDGFDYQHMLGRASET